MTDNSIIEKIVNLWYLGLQEKFPEEWDCEECGGCTGDVTVDVNDFKNNLNNEFPDLIFTYDPVSDRFFITN